MLPLTKVTHEHHDLLWRYVNQLNALADCLNGDCLDSARLAAQLPQLRDVHDGLVQHLIPHMETVEVAVHPTLNRLLSTRGVTAPMAVEHEEIRRLVAALGRATSVDAAATIDRASVLTLRRVLLRLYVLLKAHLSEEELYLPVLEGRLTAAEEAALARALDHLVSERL
jgi:hypothetical protein